MEIVLPEEPFIGYDLSTTQEISVTEYDDSYEVTLVLQEETEYGPNGNTKSVTTTTKKRLWTSDYYNQLQRHC